MLTMLDYGAGGHFDDGVDDHDHDEGDDDNDDNAPEKKRRGRSWPLSVATHSPSSVVYDTDDDQYPRWLLCNESILIISDKLRIKDSHTQTKKIQRVNVLMESYFTRAAIASCLS